MLKIKKIINNNRIEYHIIRPNGSIVDIEFDYGKAWVRMLVYENLENWILRFAEKIEYSGLQNNCGFKTTVCANFIT